MQLKALSKQLNEAVQLRDQTLKVCRAFADQQEARCDWCEFGGWGFSGKGTRSARPLRIEIGLEWLLERQWEADLLLVGLSEPNERDGGWAPGAQAPRAPPRSCMGLRAKYFVGLLGHCGPFAR